MNIIKILAVSVLALVSSISLVKAERAAGDFDLDALSVSALDVPLMKAGIEINTGNVKAAGVHNTWSPKRDCRIVEIYANEGPSLRRRVDLTSTITQTTCETGSAHDSNGNSISSEYCYVSLQAPYTWTVTLDIKSRQLYSTEMERVEVCYDFMKNDGLSYRLLHSPYSYNIRRIKTGDISYTLEFNPIKREPKVPEAAVLEVDRFSYDDIRREFKLELRNNFTAEYYGNKVHVGVELVEDKFFDSSLGMKVFEFAINRYPSTFVVTFKESDFSAEKDLSDSRGKAKRFFLKWGFKVKGDLFKDEHINKGKTEAVTIMN